MILRRPYAFLIKHFRLIHLILLGLLGYITYKASTMLSFFKDYISNNGNLVINSSEYISYFIFVAIIFIMVISVVIFFLMRYKKKPKLFYVILVIVSIIASVVMVYSYNNIKVLETTVLSGREVRLFRDISRLNFWILFVTCIPILIRGLGFDIKKFNFSSDLKELNLEDKDSEEVEVTANLDSDSVVRISRRFLRELKYYYVDNKFILNIIIGVVIVILIMVYPFNRYVVNRDLNEGEVFGTSNFNLKITDSYISDRNRISKNNSYVVLKISVISKIDKYKLDLDKIVLVSGDNSYTASMKYYHYFNDIGKGYKNNVIGTSEYEDYILIYNINSKDNDEDMNIKYVGSDRLIKLKPSILK